MSFADDGYLAVDGWFTPEEMAEAREVYLRVRMSRDMSHGEAYDTLWLTPEFMRLASAKKTQHMVNVLLGRQDYAPLYLYNSRCLIQPPNDYSHCWDWHQEVFHAIPETRMVQTWAPLIHDANRENGTIEVLPGSHKIGIAKQRWTDDGTGYALVDKEVVAEYTPKTLPMSVGSMLFFDGRLVHRSGQNHSPESRFALVGIYTAVDESFKAPAPAFGWRGKSPREWLSEQLG